MTIMLIWRNINNNNNNVMEWQKKSVASNVKSEMKNMYTSNNNNSWQYVTNHGSSEA